MLDTYLIEVSDDGRFDFEIFQFGDILMLSSTLPPNIGDYVHVKNHIEIYSCQNLNEIQGIVRAIYRDCDETPIIELNTRISNGIH